MKATAFCTQVLGFGHGPENEKPVDVDAGPLVKQVMEEPGILSEDCGGRARGK